MPSYAHKKTILLIEKQSSKSPTFAAALKRKGFELEVVQTGNDALKLAPALEPVLVILNAASLGSSGVRICRRLIDEVGKPVIHIVDEGVELQSDEGQGADVELTLPFTARKLVNRIKRLVPAERKDSVESGHIEFAKSIRVVKIPGRESRLTPKAAALLTIFLENPNKTLDRGFLMQQVWNTDYVGDTRTLDVHVRWVRQAIEPDPASPIFIRTIRGVGYRFEPHTGSRRDRRQPRIAKHTAKVSEMPPAVKKSVRPAKHTDGPTAADKRRADELTANGLHGPRTAASDSVTPADASLRGNGEQAAGREG